MTSYTFTVCGVPAPQGSKIRGRGGRMREASKRLPAWRQAIVDAAPAVDVPLSGPLACSVTFRFGRGSSHLRKDGRLRDGAPRHFLGAPDVDKLCRGVGDALTVAGLIVDDRLIVSWIATKRYCVADESPGAIITVTALRS